MHKIFTREFLTEIISSQKIVSFFIWIFLIVDLKVDNRVILHFYDEIDYKENNLYCVKTNSRSFSEFVKKKFNCHVHDECIECSQFIIEDENGFPLNFTNNESESDIKVFINTKVLKYKDFLYFFNVVQQKSELKENLQMNDFLLIMRILSVFKFKKDRNFIQIIRTLLLSVTFNGTCVNAKYNLNPKTIISSSIFKIIFREFGTIYFFDTSLFLENTSCNEIKQKLKEWYGIDFTITTKFVPINSTLITAIDKRIKYNKEFLTIFRIIFRKLKISSAILYGSHDSCQNISIHLLYILFSNIDELCFHSWEDMNFFNFMSDNIIHKNVRILTFLNCHFFSLSESFFDNFKFLQRIYFIDSYLADPISSSKLNTYLEFFTCFYNDITSGKNIENFLELASDKQHKFENIDSVSFFDLNESLMISQEFKSSKYYVCTFNRMYYESSCFELSVDVSSYQMKKNISILFKEISIKGLIFQNSSLHNNIKELSIWNSEFSNDFLRDILLIPNLETILICNCTAFFRKILTYKKQSYITDLSIHGSIFENSEEMINFVNCMSNLRKLNLYNNKNLNIFQPSYINNRIMVNYLESLVLHDNEKSKGDLLNFSGLKILKKISLDNGWYEEGSLLELLINESLSNIHDLSLFKFKIGIKDDKAMIRCSKIQNLFFCDCELINITFSQLFDVKKSYIIEKLVLGKIVLTIIDILFLSNLNGLKYLHLDIKKFFIDTKEFFNVILLNKSTLKIKMQVPKRYCREINYFKEVFQLSNFNIYEL